MHLRYSNIQRRFQLVGMKRLQVSHHTSCACECITKHDECTARGQLYRAEECRCSGCSGVAKQTCLARRSRTNHVLSRFIIWNAARCQCECRPPGGVWHCSSGFKFNSLTCRYSFENFHFLFQFSIHSKLITLL